MTTECIRIPPDLARGVGRGERESGLGRLGRASMAAWRGAIIDPLHRVLDHHERRAALTPLNAATLRDLGIR